MLAAMARGGYKHTRFDYAIVDNAQHGWRVRLTIDGVDYDSHDAYKSEMLARSAVQSEARSIIDEIELKAQPGIPG